MAGNSTTANKSLCKIICKELEKESRTTNNSTKGKPVDWEQTHYGWLTGI
jgi:hypothetical protein